MADSIQGIGFRPAPEQLHARRALTDEQKSQVQTILAKYDPAKVTQTDAKAIFQSFREAGIRPGAGLRETIEASGFNAEQLRSLAPPEGRPGGHRPPGGPGQEDRPGASLNVSSLQSLQSILEPYDLKNLSSDQQTELMTKLNQAGLMKSRTTIDLSA